MRMELYLYVGGILLKVSSKGVRGIKPSSLELLERIVINFKH